MDEFVLPDDFPDRCDDPTIHRRLASFLSARRDTASLIRAVDIILERLGVAKSVRIFQVIQRAQAGDSDEVSPRFLVDCQKRDRQAIALEDLAGAASALTTRAPIEIEWEGAWRRVEPIGAEKGLLLVLDGFHQDDTCRGVVQDLTELAGNLYHLHSRSERDDLTGLLNRPAFDCKLDQLLQDVSKKRRREDGDKLEYFLALIEVDQLKRVRDHFGHGRADEVLAGVARQMERQFRHTDFLYRYGGEEFAAMLFRLTEPQALSVMERFRAQIEAEATSRVGSVTVSIGLCQLEEAPAATILDRAHKALYFSKSFGCNRVSSYGTLVAEGLLEETVLGEEAPPV